METLKIVDCNTDVSKNSNKYKQSKGPSDHPTASSHQIAHRQHGVELIGHGVVLQSHEQGVEHDAYGDTKIQKRIHHHELHPLLQLQPPGAAAPYQVPFGK